MLLLWIFFFFAQGFYWDKLFYYIDVIFVYVINSIAYIHPVYGAGVQTHNLLIMSPLPLPLDHGSLQNVLLLSFH